MQDNCIFCKLANGVYPTDTVYEDEDFRAILDIAPAAKGHILLLPKKHMADLFEMDSSIAANALPVLQKIAAAMKEELHCDGLNLLQNNGEAAGQTVFHLHFHLIPRYIDDTVTVPWEKLEYKEGDTTDLSKRISDHIR